MTEQTPSLLDAQAKEPDLTSNDPYRVLGLNRTATQSDVKRAYFRLIRQYTPENDPENFKLVRAAYDKLKNASQRTETDLFLPQAPPKWTGTFGSETYDTKFHASDVLLALRSWGDLGRTNFEDDFRDIDVINQWLGS